MDKRPLVVGHVANFGISLDVFEFLHFGWFFSVFKKNQVLGYSWSTLLWHRCYYPHRSRDALFPVCGIFPTILTYMIMLKNCKKKYISVDGCSQIQGTKFNSSWNLMKPGSQSETYSMEYYKSLGATDRQTDGQGDGHTNTQELWYPERVPSSWDSVKMYLWVAKTQNGLHLCQQDYNMHVDVFPSQTDKSYRQWLIC